MGGLERFLSGIRLLDEALSASGGQETPAIENLRRQLDSLSFELSMSEADARALGETLDNLRGANSLQEQAEAARSAASAYREALGSVDAMNSAQRAIYGSLLDVETSALRLAAIEEGRRQNIEETTRGLQNTLAVQQAINESGDSSLRVLQLRQNIERQSLILSAQRQGATNSVGRV
jgi:hypothetical protein